MFEIFYFTLQFYCMYSTVHCTVKNLQAITNILILPALSFLLDPDSEQ